MAKDLDKLTREELGKLFPIIISQPNPEWKNLFEKEKQNILNLLGKQLAIRIAHIGSTAVPNLASKPTIDIQVEIPDSTEVEQIIIEAMTSGGYHYLKDHPDHLMFVKGYTPNGFEGQCFHIHMEPVNHHQHRDRLYFRDYLIANPAIAREYQALKLNLAEKYRFDRDAYTEAKTEFIKDITRLAIQSFS